MSKTHRKNELTCDHCDQPVEVDITSILAKKGMIADIWSIADVQSRRPDLNEKQAWHVLLVVEKELNAVHGITWEIIEWTALELYPKSKR